MELSADLLDLDKAVDNIKKDLIKAEYRAINVVSKRAVAEIARDISSVEKFKIGSVKRRFHIARATPKKLYSRITVRSKRLIYPRLRAIRKGGKNTGISFYSPQEKETKRLTERISWKGGVGSKPFIITGRQSGAKIPVYVAPAYVNVKGGGKRKAGAKHPREVLTIMGPSLAHMARIDFNKRIKEYALREMKKQFSIERDKIRAMKAVK